MKDCEDDAKTILYAFMKRFTFGYFDPTSTSERFLMGDRMSKKLVVFPKVIRIIVLNGQGIVVETSTCFLLVYEQLEAKNKGRISKFWNKKFQYNPILQDLKTWIEKTKKYEATKLRLRYFRSTKSKFENKNIYYVIRCGMFIEAN